MRTIRCTVWRSGWALLLAGALAMGLSACGGSDTPTAPPAPTPTPCTQEVLFQDNGSVPAGWLIYDDFSVPRPGRLDVTMDWTNAESPVGFYLVPANTCSLEEFNGRSCEFVIRSEPSSAKPRLISTPNFTQGNYRWIVANFSEEDESLALEIVLSEGACAALAGGRPSASAQEGVNTPAARGARQN